MGRTNTQRQKIGGTTYTLGYAYNYLGQMTAFTYASGRVITYGVDAATRLSSVADSANRISASGFGYAANGGVETETWGNGAIQSITHNRMLQPKSLALSRNGVEVQRFDYKYGVADIESGAVDESKNTGQVARAESFIAGAKQWQQRYTYDAVGRLAKAKEVRGDNGAQVWQTAYTYDRWGNRYQSGSDNSGTTYEQVLNSDVNTSTNRFISTVQKPMSYDEAGQIISDGKFRGMQYQYDANGRMRWAARLDGTGATSVTFDGGGQRVQTILNGSTRNFVYNIAGQVVAEYRSGALDREYVYQNGAVLATDEQPRSCSLTTSTFVNTFYSVVLNGQSNGTDPLQWITTLDQAMAQGFDPLLSQTQNLGTSLFTSTVYANRSRTNTEFVTDLYLAYLQRDPDQGGLDFWVYQLTNNGASRETIRGEFARSLEFQYKVKGVCSTLDSTATVKYVFMDHQGSTRALMDASGNVLARHDYLPYGEELWANTGMRTPAQQFGAMDQTRVRYGLTSKDEATGLEHTWWRKYENSSGRWTGPDPLGGSIDDPQSFNRYTYAANDPVNLVDPSGLRWRASEVCFTYDGVKECWPRTTYWEDDPTRDSLEWKPGGNGGGGGQNTTKKPCTFNVNLTGMKLNQAQQTAIEREMNRLFASTGHRITINQPNGADANYTLSLTQNTRSLPPSERNDLRIYGNTPLRNARPSDPGYADAQLFGGKIPGERGYVYMNRPLFTSIKDMNRRLIIAARVGAHEVTHYLWQNRDHADGLMAGFPDYSNDNADFTIGDSIARAMDEWCNRGK